MTMVKLPNTVVMIGIVLAILAVTCEIFSIAAFYGFGAEAWPVCGSACEVWPGIPTSGYCILICVLRNGAYILLFYAGLSTGCAAAGVLIGGVRAGRRVAVARAPASR
jgi:hypothetical protein